MSWTNRSHFHKTNFCTHDTQIVESIPCGRGIDCTRSETFDLLKHSGAKDMLKKRKEQRKFHLSVDEAEMMQLGQGRSTSAQHASAVEKEELARLDRGLEELKRAKSSPSGLSLLGAALKSSRADAGVSSTGELQPRGHSSPSPHKGHASSAGTASPSSNIGDSPSSTAKKLLRAGTVRQHDAVQAASLSLKSEYTAPPTGRVSPSLRTRDSTQLTNESYLPTPDQYQGPWGDNFKLGRLLELAGADLDKDFNFDEWTSRQSGTVLEVRAVYSNLHHWISFFGYKEVRYHYEVNELALPYMSRTELAAVQPLDFPNTRVYEVKHGVLVWFKVSGQFGNFSIIYLLLMLVTAFALFASATTVTDFVAAYLHSKRDNYFQLMYETSPDFSDDMWKCDKCGYYNFKDREHCERIPAWKSVHDQDIEPCGEKKPSS